MQLREVNLKSQIKDRTTLEKQVEGMKAQVAAASQSSKVRVPPVLLPSILGYVLAESSPALGYRFKNRGRSGSN